MSLLAVRGLGVEFETPRGRVRAVDGLDYELEPGETLGIVGESGSGKSVSALAALGLVPCPPGRIDPQSSVRLEGRELTALSQRELRALRGDRLAMIFQDPMSSLNPFLTVGRQLTEVLEVHRGLGRREARARSIRGLGEVGIPDPEERLAAYPHQLSGGLRQRVMIAMALLCEPALLFADEPTTALDVTIQAQILELLGELQERRGTAIVLITHDLGVVAGRTDRVLVMYAGRAVESGPTSELLVTPHHPYTQGLLRSVPSLTGDPTQPLHSIAGQPPDLTRPPAGCAFAPRCPLATEACRHEAPQLRSAGERDAACFELENAAASWSPGAIAEEAER